MAGLAGQVVCMKRKMWHVPVVIRCMLNGIGSLMLRLNNRFVLGAMLQLGQYRTEPVPIPCGLVKCHVLIVTIHMIAIMIHC